MNNPQLTTVTAFSLLQSIVKIPQYVKQAKALGYTQLGITDYGNLSGMLEFIEMCQKEHVKPIIGLNLTYYTTEDAQPSNVYLFAKTNAGLKQLMTLSSRHEIGEHLQIADFPAGEGLFYLLPVQEKPELALESEAIKRWMQQVGTEFLYFGIPYKQEGSAEQFAPYVEQGLKPLAYHPVTSLVAEDSFAVRVAKHIKDGTKIEDLRTEIFDYHPENYLVSSTELEQWFIENKYEEALVNARYVADNCDATLPLHQKLLPQFPLENNTPDQYLKELCLAALEERVPNYSSVYKERLLYELSIIHQMGFDDYFLIVWDVMRFAHESQIVTGAGRGSAAGSLVAYVLSITDVDPIHYHLLFERFLNPERKTMPDIDLDFPDNRREELLHYVRQKYGQAHVAQIGTFGTMATKMVLRDVGRVFGISQSESNRWSNAVPKTLGITLQQAYEQSKNLQTLVQTNERYQKMYQVARVLEGLPRHISTHAAGVVIADQNLIDLVPLQAGQAESWLTQFTMIDVERLGLLKMDFLGLRNLSIIDDTLKGIRALQREEINLKKIPLDDPATLALFQKGDTAGVFQFESAGIRKVLQKVEPENIEEIAAVNALYRPGPMGNIDTYVRRKKGLEKIEYIDPSLVPILEVTKGVIIYEEQIMQVAQKMAGYTLGQADILRRGISKKNADILEAQRQSFIDGAQAKGHTLAKANEIYNYIEKFANYGFNRSHAFAYSFVAYQMAYLKVHYPGPFYKALFQSAQNQPIKIREYIHDAKKQKIQILPPSINQSNYGFRLHTVQAIRFGLSSIKGLRREFIQAILDERRENGYFNSFEQFLYRLNARNSKLLKEEYIKPLILVGAFDDFHSNRHQLYSQLEDKIQSMLFSGGSLELLSMFELKEREVADYQLVERLAFEEEYLGVYLSGHPTRQFTKILKLKKIHSMAEMNENQWVTILFYVKNIKEIRTKKGEAMAILEGDDESGTGSVTIFPENYRQLRKIIEQNKVLYIEGKAQKNRFNGQLQILPKVVKSAVEEEQSISDKTCYIKVLAEKDIAEVWQQFRTLIQASPGKMPIVLYYVESGKKILLDSENWLAEQSEVAATLALIFGKDNIVVR